MLAIRPLYPRDWALENLIVVATLPVLVYGYRRLRFSNVSCLALFVLYVMHEAGAHHTYAEVPYDSWTMELSGFSTTFFFRIRAQSLRPPGAFPLRIAGHACRP